MGLTAEEWKMVGAEIRRQAEAANKTVDRYRIELLYWALDERVAPPLKQKFKANHVQCRFMDRMWFYNVVLKARQHGMSLLQSILMLDKALFTPNYRGGIIDRTDAEAKKKLARIRYAYDHLDDPDDPRTAMLGAAIKEAIPLVAPSNDHTLTFANGSQIYAATSLRGGTINYLWISELGKIALDDPHKAEEIMGGSLEAVHPGNIIVIESTHEGGRFGENYRMIRLAQKSPPVERMTKLHWMFHFFGWQDNPNYRIPLSRGQPLAATPDHQKYFAEVEKETGKRLMEDQKHWYILKSATQRDMARQYPATPEEALRAQTEGAIYADIIAKLRGQGRVGDVVVNHGPLFTAWDLGMTDAVGIWLLQFAGYDIHALAFHCANGATPAQHAAVVLQWERDFNHTIQYHLVPHDATQLKPGGTWMQLLTEAGLRNLVRVERIPNIWIGINQTRALLPRFRFNARMCEKEFDMGNDRIWPSGLGALEGYRKKLEAQQGAIREVPIHDECESGASSLRTFAEAHERGLLQGPSKPEIQSRKRLRGQERAITGLSQRPRKQLLSGVVMR